MRTLRVVLIILAVAGILGANLAAVPVQASPLRATTPRFEPAKCKFTIPDGMTEGDQVKCGFVVVPEDRSKPTGKQVKLAVAIYKSLSDTPAPEPIIYLEGGPGGGALQDFGPYMGEDSISSFLLPNHNVVLFDQRGAGLSQPSLACTEIDDQDKSELEQQMTTAEEAQAYIDASVQCHDRLKKKGIDLNQYTSAVNAADVEDIRIALGYEKVNLYGISYGTRLALTVMRDFPDGIRSVIIDGVYPPSVDLFATLAENVQRSLDTLFAGCAKNAACKKKFPDLEKYFYSMVKTLNDKPIKVKIVDDTDGKAYQWVLTGNRLVGMVFQMLYVTQYIPVIPLALSNLKSGKPELFARVAQSLIFGGSVSEGMYLSVECAEEVPFPGPDPSADATRPEIKAAFITTDVLGACKLWGSKAAKAIENEPVTSDIPTLVMSGEYDPITPPAWGEEAAKTLSNSFRFVFPGFGHGTLGEGACPAGIFQAFLLDPTTAPDASCIDKLSGPKFLTALKQ